MFSKKTKSRIIESVGALAILGGSFFFIARNNKEPSITTYPTFNYSYEKSSIEDCLGSYTTKFVEVDMRNDYYFYNKSPERITLHRFVFPEGDSKYSEGNIVIFQYEGDKILKCSFTSYNDIGIYNKINDALREDKIIKVRGELIPYTPTDSPLKITIHNIKGHSLELILNGKRQWVDLYNPPRGEE